MMMSFANGKLYGAKPIFSIDCGGLGTPFLSYHFLNVQRFVMFPGAGQGWNKAKAARLLGISRPTLCQLINLHNLRPPDRGARRGNNL